MRNILSLKEGTPILGAEIKEWIHFHSKNNTSHSKIAEKMSRYLSIADSKEYWIDLHPAGTGAGEIGRTPTVNKLSGGGNVLNYGTVIQNKNSGKYGTVEYSTFGFSIHTIDERSNRLQKSIAVQEREIRKHWNVGVELPKGYVIGEYGGVRKA